MILVFFSALLAMFSIQFFTLNFEIQGLNRTVINTPIELMFATIRVGDDQVSFDKVILERTLNSYYENQLPRYCKSYQVDYYYYNPIDESMCLSDKCNAVEISINCKLTMNYDYSRIMYYEIKDNYHG